MMLLLCVMSKLQKDFLCSKRGSITYPFIKITSLKRAKKNMDEKINFEIDLVRLLHVCRTGTGFVVQDTTA